MLYYHQMYLEVLDCIQYYNTETKIPNLVTATLPTWGKSIAPLCIYIRPTVRVKQEGVSNVACWWIFRGFLNVIRYFGLV